MKRILMTLAAVLLTTATADAGNLRDRLAARFPRLAGGSCAACSGPQAQQTPAYAGVSYQPGPVQQAAGTVLVTSGQVVQSVGQAVQAWPVVFRPTCAGGTCSGGVCR